MLADFLPFFLMIVMALGLAVTLLKSAEIFGPRRPRRTKASPYESGMDPVGSARERYSVKFYLVAMIFIVFDVELVFLYPWAVTFPNIDFQAPGAAEWLVRILFFMFTTVIAYLYGFRKGVFKFD